MADICHNTPGLPEEAPAIIRDMILISFDATEGPGVTPQNITEARAALAEALDVVEGMA